MTERLYTVTGINGFRRANLTRIEAIKMAIKMTDQMRRNGWRGKVRVFYRDGSEVPTCRLLGIVDGCVVSVGDSVRDVRSAAEDRDGCVPDGFRVVRGYAGACVGEKVRLTWK